MTSAITTKTCSSCKLSLSIDAFSKAAGYKDGYRGQCKSCRVQFNKKYPYKYSGKKSPSTPEQMWKYQIKYKFGITPEQYSLILESQGFACAICGGKSPGGHIRRFHVDHCHASGSVRGLLCHRCNVTLGLAGDTVELVNRFVNYLSGAESRIKMLLE